MSLDCWRHTTNPIRLVPEVALHCPWSATPTPSCPSDTRVEIVQVALTKCDQLTALELKASVSVPEVFVFRLSFDDILLRSIQEAYILIEMVVLKA